MKPFQKLKAVACFFICITYFSISGNASNNPIDTITPPPVHYDQSSYRLTITSIKVEKNNSKTAKIVYNLSNSGLNPVKLGKGRTIPRNLVFEFDESLSASNMSHHADAIASAIRSQKMTLRTGQLLMSNKLKVNLNGGDSDMVIIIKETSTTTPEEVLVEEVAVEEATETITETPIIEEEGVEEITETVAETSIEIKEVSEIREEPKEQVLTKMPPLENTETIILNKPESSVDLPKIETVEITKEKVKEVKTTPIVTVTDLEVAQEQVTETIEEPTVKTKATVEPTVKNSSEEITMNEVMEPIVNEVEEETEEFADAPHYEVNLEEEVKDKDFLEEDICADLVMESVKIIKQSSNSVTLEYVVANYGNGSAALFGESKKDDDNVAIKAHLSKSRKLTRGSIPLKGAFISKGVKNKSGMLLPKDRVTNTMKIDVSKMTKFTPVLILTLDGFQDIQECDEMNNIVYINLIEVNKVAYAKPSRPKQEDKVLSKVEEK